MKMAKFCQQFFKWFSFTVSFALFIFSVALIYFSSIALHYLNHFCEVAHEDDGKIEFCYAPIALSILSVFICIATITGLLGYLWKSHKMIFVNALMFTVLLTLMIGASITIFYFKVSLISLKKSSKDTAE